MKPELLLPAGNVEMFNAALEGGADAFYLGMQNFNARRKATNFTLEQLQSVLHIAEKNEKKVYLTLNTVVKNEELPELIELLSVLSKTSISAVIIQDWGVYNIIKKYFPTLSIQSSTQMQVHNSGGVNFADKMGFERVIVARELTMEELEAINDKTVLPLEVFVHGDLSFSLSGTDLFSSFLTGNAANRGLDEQPCRRMFETSEDKRFIFNLKDLQLINFVPYLSNIGIQSLKVEGRMRSAEYANKVAEAYRMVIDNPDLKEQARKILELDLGREKTPYFIGNNLQNPTTETPGTGMLLGKITVTTAEGFSFNSPLELLEGYRIRVQSPEGEVKESFKLKDFSANKRNFIKVNKPDSEAKKGDMIYLSEFSAEKFSSTIEVKGEEVPQPIQREKIDEMIKGFAQQKAHNQRQIFVRIDQIEWIKKIYIRSIDKVILNFPKRQWKDFMTGNPFVQKNKRKFIIQLPKFISEGDLSHYKDFCNKCKIEGFKHFMISQLSQIDLIPDDCTISASENIYLFNDAAIALLKEKGIQHYIYPFENDKKNLLASADRDGIVPLLFNPDLLFSRMTVKTDDQNSNTFIDDNEIQYNRIVRDGITIITPEDPVAIFEEVKDLTDNGFHNYLIDCSRATPSQNKFNTYIKHFHESEQLLPLSNFNFIRGLK